MCLFSLHSNGKMHSDKLFGRFELGMRYTVSIPFKRESGSQVADTVGVVIVEPKCFNSLQTGKRIARLENLGSQEFDVTVSIPFKRESGSQAFFLFRMQVSLGLGFNSLQTGKRIARIVVLPQSPYLVSRFQFPSNGKADRKIKSGDTSASMLTLRFNSLQTGKRIASL